MRTAPVWVQRRSESRTVSGRPSSRSRRLLRVVLVLIQRLPTHAHQHQTSTERLKREQPTKVEDDIYLPPGFLSLRKEEPVPELSPQTPVSGYSWPRMTQMASKVVSPSCFRSSLSSCPFSWCPLCHSFCPSVVFESCNVSRPSMYSLLDNVYDIIYTFLMSYPDITFVVT